MWHLGTWFCGVLGSAGLRLGVSDTRGPFQPKRFRGSPGKGKQPARLEAQSWPQQQILAKLTICRAKFCWDALLKKKTQRDPNGSTAEFPGLSKSTSNPLKSKRRSLHKLGLSHH